MSRKELLQLLDDYIPHNDSDAQQVSRIIAFVKQHPQCFDRTLSQGHITASAWILNFNQTRILLTHHAKLNKWLQLGGHADGDSDIIQVAIKEAQEESGLKNFHLKQNQILDVDVHLIPARKNEPEHFHYDIRFWLEADDGDDLIKSQESHDLQWFTAEEFLDLNPEESLLRMARKTNFI